jgi:hypothetical protein
MIEINMLLSGRWRPLLFFGISQFWLHLITHTMRLKIKLPKLKDKMRLQNLVNTRRLHRQEYHQEFSRKGIQNKIKISIVPAFLNSKTVASKPPKWIQI